LSDLSFRAVFREVMRPNDIRKDQPEEQGKGMIVAD